MIGCIIFAIALYLAKNANVNILGTENLINPLPPNSLSRLQHRFREDWNIQSFAGRPQFELRGPFGPSPDQKYIQAQEFFDNEYYQARYKKDKYALQIKNQDWRLDPTTFGVTNNYADQPHMPEDNLHYIREFAESGLREQNQNIDFF